MFAVPHPPRQLLTLADPGRESTPAEALPSERAGAKAAETSVLQGGSDVRERRAAAAPSSAVGAPLLVRGRLIGFLSSNIQPRLCSRDLEGHPGLWVVLSLLTVG